MVKDGKIDLGKKEAFVGLTDDEAVESGKRLGLNTLSEKKQAGFFKKLIGGFADPIIRILLCALAVTLILPGGEGGMLDAIGIAVAVFLAVLVSTLCEYGSERAFRKMQAEARLQSCTVIRNGERRVMPIGAIVVGDVVVLRAGEGVPADGVMIDGEINCDQSALNGESKEKHKSAIAQEAEAEYEKRFWHAKGAEMLLDPYSVFRGSLVTGGEGLMKVLAVGDNSYYGRMAGELQESVGESPLKMKLATLAGLLSKFGYCCAFLVGLSDLLFNTVFNSEFAMSVGAMLSALLHSLTLAVSVVVMAVPEGLPMMITVVLSSNMIRMQREHVMVRKPVGIETAGGLNVLFTDKTGTLTYGKPKVRSFEGADFRAARVLDLPDAAKELIELVSHFAVASSVAIRGGKRVALGGDATDRAFMDAVLRDGKVHKNIERTAFFPFNSANKLCAATVDLSGNVSLKRKYGDSLALVKGAPEILIENCEYIFSCDGSKKRIDRVLLLERLRNLASGGMRVIGIAYSDCDGETVKREAKAVAEGRAAKNEVFFKNAVFIGFVCIRDELRQEAKRAISDLEGAGIRTVMITGDSPITAEAIAREAGIIRKGESAAESVITGSELAAMSDTELGERLSRIKVVARALPQDKSRLVRLARARGAVVGMTGDGLNDAPALKLADVGFAMGSGAEVAKEAGDIVITDNNISSIVSAVHYGRTIFRSIRNFIVFQLTMNLCAVGVSIVGPFIGYETPISVMQMLWINIIIDTLAALAFAGEAPLASYMRELPTRRDEAVLSADMFTKILSLGTYTLLLCIYFLISPKSKELFCASEGDATMLTGFFALFIFSGIIGSLNARTTRVNMFSGLMINPTFIAIMSGVFTLQVLFIYYGGGLFGTVPLNGAQLGYVCLLALTVVPAGRIYALAARKKPLRRGGQASRSAIDVGKRHYELSE